ncbi:MAG TPA: hypothetical protein DCS55_01385 [Acidimicrobiaceae bacterium]|nr:hypothetical protein [Acidimicrobiaceae bacterium]
MLTRSQFRARGVPDVYEHSVAERTRSLLLQVILVGLLVLGALAVFAAVSSATEPVSEGMERQPEPHP